jgi:hypothetical protein
MERQDTIFTPGPKPVEIHLVVYNWKITMQNQYCADSENNPDGGLALSLLPARLAVCRLDAASSMPDWAGGPLSAVTRTPDELSVVCAQANVPDGVQMQGGWRALRVAGPLDFSLTGILAALAGPLATAGVSIFAISTYDTDYVLVQETTLERACAALRAAGHHIHLTEGDRP